MAVGNVGGRTLGKEAVQLMGLLGIELEAVGERTPLSERE